MYAWDVMSKKEKAEILKEEQPPQAGQAPDEVDISAVTAAPTTVEVTQESAPEAVNPEEARISELEAEVARLTKEMETEKDLFTRKLADMDNYRKRLIRDKETSIQYANERLLQDLIQILDDFDRAIVVGTAADDVTIQVDGIKLIHKHLTEMLDRNWGLRVMTDIVGKDFSPHDYEALLMEEGESYKTETVLAELQKGYYLHDRVLRTAKVKVGKPLGV
jgi:molecular chaperone GrpE